MPGSVELQGPAPPHRDSVRTVGPRRVRLSADERLANAAFGASALSWMAMGLRHDLAAGISPQRWTIAALHLCVAVLFLTRAPLRRSGSVRQSALALPAVTTGGLAMASAAPWADWPAAATAVFVGGGVLAIGSLAALGDSFAILPALREVVARGPYRLVRHPAYAGELLMIGACCATAIRVYGWLPFALALPATIARIRAEESLLLGTATYRGYARRVPDRLVPGIW